ncbi:MAG: hypothetical protein AB7P99_14235, partial [Vicinamibacterales bacterium]
ALASLSDQFDAMRERALALGLSIEEINRAQGDALRDMEKQSEATLSGLQSTLAGLEEQSRQVLGLDALTGFRQSLQFGPQAAASPLDQFSAARSALDTLSTSALGGDLQSIRAFPALAQQVLGLARDTFASGPEFQAVFVDVNRVLNQVIAQQETLQASITADLGGTMRETAMNQIEAIRAQIAATKEQTQQVTEALADIRRELRKVAA